MRAIAGGNQEDITKDLANSVIFRISALHGLVLALVFATETGVYRALKIESAIEANAIADVFFDSRRYGMAAQGGIEEAMADYVRTASGVEWQELGVSGRLLPEGWAHWDKAYELVLDLEPRTLREESLRGNMLERIHTIAEIREMRMAHAVTAVSGMFWFAAVAGVVLVAVGYYSYPPTRYNLVLLGMFGAYTGIIMFFIFAFGNPFGNPGVMDPNAYLAVAEQLEAAMRED